jgi:hypothetical protein
MSFYPEENRKVPYGIGTGRHFWCFLLVLRIQMDPYRFFRLDPDPGGKKLPTKIEKSEDISCFVQLLDVFSNKFLRFLVIKTLLSRIRIDLTSGIEIRIETNADPQHCFR